MRIDYTNYDYCERNPRVWLDGVELDTRTINAADEEGGYVMLFLEDEDGNIICDPHDETKAIPTRRDGRVQITLDGADRPDEA